ncbi:MAG TPA: hypothetical protein VFE58_04535 [Tepidisphaeraceae bacterium]|nr:hypothetical protein [Tepidisphaeraceae bacterium]
MLTPLLLLGSIAAGPATRPATSEPSGDFVVEGKVVDEGGEPMKNVAVYARCGTQNNTIRTGITKSDKDGKYRLAFAPGVMEERGLGHEVVGFQNALIVVVKGGYFEKNLGRQGDLAMSDDPNHMTDKDYAGVVAIHKPYELNFVLCKGGEVSGKVVDPDGKVVKGLTLYLSGAEVTYLMAVKTDEEGMFKFRDVPTNYDWSFLIHDRFYAEDVETKPFKLTEAGEKMEMTLTSDAVKHTLVSTPAAATP